MERVNDIMRSLILEETEPLGSAYSCLEGASADRLVEAITEALEHMSAATRQLGQYREMLLAFEQARYTTILPQPIAGASSSEDDASAIVAQAVADTKGTLDEMNQFNEFLGKIADQAATAAEDAARAKPEEG